MREESVVATRRVDVGPSFDCVEGELLAAALAAALVEYKKCIRDRACRQEQEASGAWRSLGRWEQLALARRG